MPFLFPASMVFGLGSSSAPDQSPETRLPPPRWLFLSVWGTILSFALLQFSVRSTSDRLSDWRFLALDWGLWLVAAPVVIWLASRWPINHQTWKWAAPLHIALGFVIAAGLGALVWMAAPPRRMVFHAEFRGGPGAPARDVFLLNHDGPPPPPTAQRPPEEFGPRPMQRQPGEFGPPPPPAHWYFVFMRSRGAVLAYWTLVAMTHAAAYHRRSLLREQQVIAAEARLAEARLTALQAQLQPHFLFNTLNAISSMVYKKPAAADAMICALSELLRRVLAASPKREVSLSEELEFARHYLALQQERFPESLRVRWEIDEAAKDAAVPTLLLQPLLENAVVHAIQAQDGVGEIAISAQRHGNTVSLRVEDSGCPTPEGAARASDKSGGIGLSNTQERLQALYGNKHRFAFELEPGRGARVQIEIPYRTCDDGNTNRNH